jgi:hypothetical protein
VCSDPASDPGVYDTAPVMTYWPPPRARRRGRGVEKRGFRGKERENPGEGKARKKARFPVTMVRPECGVAH